MRINPKYFREKEIRTLMIVQWCLDQTMFRQVFLHHHPFVQFDEWSKLDFSCLETIVEFSHKLHSFPFLFHPFVIHHILERIEVDS